MSSPSIRAADGEHPDRALLDPATIEAWALAYLRHAPFSLCLRELHRLVAAEMLADDSADENGQRPSPVLDVGCGDGFWWTLRGMDGRDIYGIDISAKEIGQAASRIHASVADVSEAPPLAPLKFREIVGNCSLEHVKDIDSALRNLRSSAAPGARLVMFVPAPQWAFQGKIQQMLLHRAPRVAMTISGAFNGFFQHWHLYDVPVWHHLLEQSGWTVSETVGLGSPRAEFLFRAFLPSSFVAFMGKTLLGEYPNRLLRFLPNTGLLPFQKLLSWAVRDPFVAADSPHAYEFAIVAERSE